MKKLDELSLTIKNLEKNIENKVIEAQKMTAKQIYEDVKANAPIRTGEYQKSIKITDTKIVDNVIKTEIYTDLKVGGSNPKWMNVPLGCLIEWGTGIEGESTNTYPHGYSYRQSPWCYYDEYLHMWVTTTGMIARPHFLPALRGNIENYKKNIKEAIKDE